MEEYEDVQLIGTGSCGDVRSVKRSRDGVLFAQKELNKLEDKPRKRFVEEVRILSRLDHANIVKVVDTKLDKAPFWFVMPLYRTSLKKELLSVVGKPARVAKIFSAVLNGAEHAHGHQVIHRDIKADNVLLNDDDDVVLSDFGIGRALDADGDRFTVTGRFLGSQNYASPEQQTDAKHVDHRSDIYALGRLLYELHTGPLTSAVQVADRLPHPVAAIVKKCTEHDPADRYQSVTELKSAWLQVINGDDGDSDASKANRIISDLISCPQIQGGADELLALLEKNPNDGEVLQDCLMRMPTQSFAIMLQLRPAGVRTVVERFCRYLLSQNSGDKFVDDVSTRCGNLFMAGHDALVRASLIRCLVALGVKSKRRGPLAVVAELFQAASGQQELKELATRLKTIPEADRREVGRWLDLDDLDPALASLFR